MSLASQDNSTLEAAVESAHAHSSSVVAFAGLSGQKVKSKHFMSWIEYPNAQHDSAHTPINALHEGTQATVHDEIAAYHCFGHVPLFKCVGRVQHRSRWGAYPSP